MTRQHHPKKRQLYRRGTTADAITTMHARSAADDKNTPSTVKEMSKQRSIITSRFHGAIVAEVLRKPYVALYYSKKFLTAFSEIESSGVFVDASMDISDEFVFSLNAEIKKSYSERCLQTVTTEYLEIIERHLRG